MEVPEDESNPIAFNVSVTGTSGNIGILTASGIVSDACHKTYFPDFYFKEFSVRCRKTSGVMDKFIIDSHRSVFIRGNPRYPDTDAGSDTVQGYAISTTLRILNEN